MPNLPVHHEWRSQKILGMCASSSTLSGECWYQWSLTSYGYFLHLKKIMTSVQVPWLPEVFLSQSDWIGEEKPLVQAVEFFEKAGSMGCRFIFPESDFDPSNSIGSGNLSVLTSTLIGLATESSSNKFSIAINLIPCAHCGHNWNVAKFRKSSLWRQKKFSGF